MEFKKYSSIENSYRLEMRNKILEYGFNRYDWVVTEKVHGANFSFWLNDEGYKMAKRTSFLCDGDNFYNYEFVEDLYKDRLFLLYNICMTLLEDLKEGGNIEFDGNLEVVLYGEIFGGNYPAEGVEKVTNAKNVQKGVFYCPHNDFYAFDLKVNRQYINYDLFCEIMEQCGFLYAKPMYRGAYNECLAYPNEFTTTIPALFDLPEIEDNVCEGVVLKPVVAMRFPNGERVILKNKNEKFSEKQKERKPRKEKELPLDLSITDEEQVILDGILTYVTENRLRNVISKEGEITDKMFGKLSGLFMKDIMDDWKKDNNIEIESASRRKIIQKLANVEAQAMVRKNFVNIIDGNF